MVGSDLGSINANTILLSEHNPFNSFQPSFAIVCTPSIFLLGKEGGREEVEPKREREGLIGSQFLEGGCWKRGGDFFQEGGGEFLHKT